MSILPKYIIHKIDIFLQSLQNLSLQSRIEDEEEFTSHDKKESTYDLFGTETDSESVSEEDDIPEDNSCNNPLTFEQANKPGKFPYLCPFYTREDKWTKINTKPDGDCGFTSVLYSLNNYSNEETVRVHPYVLYPKSFVDTLRREIIDYISQNDIPNKQNNIKRLQRKIDQGWLFEEPDLSIIATLKNVCICLWNNNTETWTYFYPGMNTNDLVPKHDVSCNKYIYLYNDGDVTGEIEQGIHFQILNPNKNMKLWTYANTTEERDFISQGKIIQIGLVDDKRLEKERIHQLEKYLLENPESTDETLIEFIKLETNLKDLSKINDLIAKVRSEEDEEESEEESEEEESEDEEESEESEESEEGEDESEDEDEDESEDESEEDIVSIISNLKLTDQELINQKSNKKEILYEMDKCFGLL